ncbi:J domain-containing protein [Marinitoga aeolica]|uniref:J domain-containing protein n=1 Tax=Marinitoga aeolica TaxID=2809031 RepID=A0ABY8PRA6_9BACT|nr:J domain-containing protein [Marinitoga aeolica]WGS65141.1 J domain-containing protein [Marinitoga aeolica]
MEAILTFIGLLVVISFFFRFIGAIFIMLFRYPILLLFVILGIYFLFRNFRFRFYTYKTRENPYRNYGNQSQSNYGSQNYYDLRQKYDYYRSLFNLPENFTKDELKKRFRELTKKYHPDKCPDNKEKCEEQFKKINEAYEFLLKYAK